MKKWSKIGRLKNLPIHNGVYMKKFSLILLSCAFILVFSSCSSDVVNDKPTEISFSTKSVVCENEGWLYYCYVDFDKDSSLQNSKLKNYNFNAYNLKYKSLEEYNKIPIIDSSTNEVTGYTDSAVPVISYGKKYMNDIENINNWLNTTKPTSNIKNTDLGDLKLENIDVELFVSMFNEMINSDDLPNGKFTELPESDIKQEITFIDGYKWQIGYFVSHGVLKKIDIELIYENASGDIYLTDLIEDNKADDEQKQLQNVIEKIECNIIDKQEMTFEKVDDSIKNVDFSRLEKLLQSLQEG